MYAVSYLKGTAQRWFEPNLALDELDLPDHALTWHRFEEELTATFREPDPVASATAKLDNLSMKDSHHIAKYNVEFNKYAVLTGFDNRALYAKYYKGLAPRIKDGMVYAGRPNNLEGLRNRAQALDLCYWECKDEDRVYTSTSGPELLPLPLHHRPPQHPNPRKPTLPKSLAPTVNSFQKSVNVVGRTTSA